MQHPGEYVPDGIVRDGPVLELFRERQTRHKGIPFRELNSCLKICATNPELGSIEK